MRNGTAPFATSLDALADRQLIVVSNREPKLHGRGRRRILCDCHDGVAGGLVVAFESGHGIQSPPGLRRYVLRRVPLARAEVRGGYDGYATQVLWPLCHAALHEVRCWNRFWRMYQQTNWRLANAVLAEGVPGAAVWIHDYRLALCPRYLRESRPDLLLMSFWDIPWPTWDVFRICPQRAELLQGLLANDLIAFQHPRHARHFLECVAREIRANVDTSGGVVEYDGRVIDVDAFPMSVDFSGLERLASSASGERWMSRLRRHFRLEGRAVAVSVDRLDYTRGILERLHAIEQFFAQWPDYRSRVVFIQKVTPNGTRLRTYKELQGRIEAEIERLNAQFGTPGWQPIVYLPRPLPLAAVAALYRMADLCLVTPLHEGVNLAAKEFIACQVDQRGVLVLSTLAGAYDELTGAVPINPYDAEGAAEAVKHALALTAAERAGRMRRLRAYLTEHDIYWWVEQNFRAVSRLCLARSIARELTAVAPEIH